jgi:hypothetical protein
MDWESNILNLLLDKLESRTSDRQRVFLRMSRGEYPTYEECDAEEKLEIHAAVESLCAAGLVGKKWAPHEENNILDRVWLEQDRIDDAYRRANRAPMGERIAAVDGQVAACLADIRKEWLVSALKRDRGVYREEANLTGFLDLIRAVDAISEDTTMPQRVFSSQYLGDSKAFERKYRSKLLRIVKLAFDEDEDTDDQLLGRVGIAKNPALIEFCGPIALAIGNAVVDFAGMSGGCAITSTDVRRIESANLSSIARIVSIENRTSYYTYIDGEKTPDELVLYSAGFLSPERKRFYRLLAQSGKPFVHWGDIDLGGFTIFMQIKEIADQLLPIRMDRETLEAHVADAIRCDDRYLGKLRKVRDLPEYGVFTDVLDIMLEKGLRLEQENI